MQASTKPTRKKGELEGRGVQSVEVGGRILKVLADAAQPLMLRDIAQRADLAAGPAHGYLLSFRKMGMVEQDAATGRYQLGPFALQLGIARLRSADPFRIASNAVVEFAHHTGLMVAIAVWGTSGPTIVQVQESVDQIHVNVRPGAVFSLSGTATGKLFCAMLPDHIIQPRLQEELQSGERSQRVGRPAPSPEHFAREIAQIRKRGYATTEGIPVPGINAYSAPVLDHSGQMKLAITLIGPAGLVSISDNNPLLASLLAFTADISRQLGASVPDGLAFPLHTMA